MNEKKNNRFSLNESNDKDNKNKFNTNEFISFFHAKAPYSVRVQRHIIYRRTAVYI